MQEEHTKRVIYLISGPLGAGKSTVSKALAGRMEPCVLLKGIICSTCFRDRSLRGRND